MQGDRTGTGDRVGSGGIREGERGEGRIRVERHRSRTTRIEGRRVIHAECPVETRGPAVGIPVSEIRPVAVSCRPSGLTAVTEAAHADRASLEGRVGERVGERLRNKDHVDGATVGSGGGHTSESGQERVRGGPSHEVGQTARGRHVGGRVGKGSREPLRVGTRHARIGHHQRPGPEGSAGVHLVQGHVGGESRRGEVVNRAGDRDRVGAEDRVGESRLAREHLRGEDHTDRTAEGASGRRVGECHRHRGAITRSCGQTRDVPATGRPVGSGCEGGSEVFRVGGIRCGVGDCQGLRAEGVAGMDRAEVDHIGREHSGRVGVSGSRNRVAVGGQHRIGERVGPCD